MPQSWSMADLSQGFNSEHDTDDEHDEDDGFDDDDAYHDEELCHRRKSSTEYKIKSLSDHFNKLFSNNLEVTQNGEIEVYYMNRIKF